MFLLLRFLHSFSTHFVVKDTSEGGMKKIVITRLDNEADSESLLENYMINKILSYL